MGLRDPWLATNLGLRIFFLIWVLTRGSPLLGDSDYYLASMRSIWNGEWGGATFRAPGYAWILAALGGQILTLLLQTLAVWLVGVDLSGRIGRKAGLLWVFDPVILVYSNAVMSDVFFAVAIYVVVRIFRCYLAAPTWKNVTHLGLILAAAMLTRPIGVPFALLTFAVAFFPISLARVRQLVFAALIALVLVFPRLYWNAHHDGGWTIATQGKAFQISIAAAVEYAGNGLNYVEAEQRWYREHTEMETRTEVARDTLLQKWKTWVMLSVKGMARTLFGHANIEVGNMATGRLIVGPGWFSEGGSGGDWTGSERAVWILGILFAFAYVIFVYAFTLRRIPFRSDLRFTIWIALAVAGFIVAPQLYGDCRFRLPIITLLFAAAVYEKGRLPRETEKSRSS